MDAFHPCIGGRLPASVDDGAGRGDVYGREMIVRHAICIMQTEHLHFKGFSVAYNI